MRNAADHIGSHLDRAPHQRLAVRKGLDALLRKRDQLQRDFVGKFLPHLEQRPQRSELGVANVDVAADEEHPVCDLPAKDLGNPALDVLERQILDPLAPDRDALEERTAEILPGLADSQYRIEVDVGFDQGGGEQATARVDRIGGLGRPGGRRGRDTATLDGNWPEAPRTGETGVADYECGHAGTLNRNLAHRWHTPESPPR